MRRLFAMLALLALVGCVSVPKQPVADPAKTPLSAIGLYRCGEVSGAVVVTKDGKIHPVFGLSLAELKAIGDAVPAGNTASLNSVEDCAPHQGT